MAENQRSLASYQFLFVGQRGEEVPARFDGASLSDDPLFSGEVREYEAKIPHSIFYYIIPTDVWPQLRDLHFKVFWSGKTEPLLDVELAPLFPPETWEVP